LFAHNEVVPARVCIVSFTDTSGLVHSVEVAAGSLYEAAALAFAEFRSTGLADAVAPAPATTMTVAVKVPSTEHQVTMQQLVSWLTRTAKSPKEKAIKVRLRERTGL
jgi:hypothetical protein